MPVKLSREGRFLDIVIYIHKMQLLLNEKITIGQYCRAAGLGRSPYLTREFQELCNMGVLIEKVEPYRGTFKKVYSINYDNVSEFYPILHKAITDIGEQLRLL